MWMTRARGKAARGGEAARETSVCWLVSYGGAHVRALRNRRQVRAKTSSSQPATRARPRQRGCEVETLSVDGNAVGGLQLNRQCWSQLQEVVQNCLGRKVFSPPHQKAVKFS
jgi:hypothetical protein